MKPVLTIVIILIVLAIVIAAVVFYQKGTGGAFDPDKLKYFNVVPDQFTLDISPVVKELKAPTSMAIHQGTFYITTKGGKFYTFNGKLLNEVTDFSERDNFESASEGGLLGVALDPNFDNNDRLYLSYTTKAKGDGLNLIVSIFTLKGGKLKEGKKLVDISAAQKYHHGGTLRVFDNHLYLAVGDGGPQGDPKRNAQNMKLYLGKMLRISLDSPYKVKIIALGMRNPWSFSINATLGIFVADVGNAKVESVYLLPDPNPGQPYNLGWNYFEGSIPFSPDGKKARDFWPPIFEYPNSKEYGRAVIGGFYVDNLKLYIFGDYTAGALRALKYNEPEDVWEQVAENKFDKMSILCFGFDGTNVYFGSRDTIYRVIPKKI